MNENHSSIAAAILASGIWPVKKPKKLPHRDCPTKEQLMERLLWNTEIHPSGCWEWKASKTVWGYGQIKIRLGGGKIKSAKVSRLAYEVFVGSIPTGLCVCHRCDNRACLCPDHLFVGTHKENTQDMLQKGRGNRPNGQRHWGAKLTDSQVEEIKSLASGIRGSGRALSKRFGVSESRISLIIHGKSRSKTI